MNWRAPGVMELAECLSITPAALGHELVGRDQALAAWRSLLTTRSFHSALIETEQPVAGHRILGFGASVFVSTAFAANEVSVPRPGLNARIIASIVSNRSVVLTDDELRYENTCGGLHVVFLCAAWKRGILPTGQATEVEALLAFACLQSLRGYRLCQALREATESFDVEHIRSQRVFGSITGFEDFFALTSRSDWNRDRALGISNRADALAVPGSVPAILFSYHEPILGLHDEQQQLLIAALHGMTDDELARALGLKLPAIKKRWASVFQQVAEVRPDLVPGLEQVFDRKTRGPQKRHRLLAYLREHPEELRPLLRLSAKHRAISLNMRDR